MSSHKNARQRKWDLRYLGLARQIADWSKDPSTKVGAVLVRPNNSIASTGFNGFPPGEDDSPDLYADREYKYAHVIHAEVNAIDFFLGHRHATNTHHQPLEGFALYTSFPVCPECMTRIVKEGITRIVSPGIGQVSYGKPATWIRAWSDRLVESRRIALAAGIKMVVLADE